MQKFRLNFINWTCCRTIWRCIHYIRKLTWECCSVTHNKETYLFAGWCNTHTTNRLKLMSPNSSVRLRLLDWTTTLRWGNKSQWLAINSGSFHEAELPIGCEANKRTLSVNFHQPWEPTLVGLFNLSFESVPPPMKESTLYLKKKAGDWSKNLPQNSQDLVKQYNLT